MSIYTLEEQLVTQVARLFGPEDDYVSQAVLNFGLVGLALAQKLYAPRLKLCTTAKGRSALVSNVSVSFPFMIGNPPEKFIETLFTMEDIFNCAVKGKWMMLMQPVQIDKFGNTNLSFIGDKRKPSRFFVGPRGFPDNTVNQSRVYYLIAEHNRRVFVDNVDCICGVGYGPERRQGTIKWGAVHRVITNLGIFDFDDNTGHMRLKSVHSGILLQQVIDNTGFKLIIPTQVPETEPPNQEELQLIREVIDPKGFSRLDFVKGDAHKQLLEQIMQGG